MTNHFAQESGACSVLSESHTMRNRAEMRRYGNLHTSFTCDGQGFALDSYKRVVVVLLHRAIGRRNRLNG